MSQQESATHTSMQGSVTSGTKWDSEQYLRYSSDRARPMADLIARIPPFPSHNLAEGDGRRLKMIDLGCGPGNSTSFIAQHYPSAEIVGVDFSEAMLEAAQKVVAGGTIRFEQGDIDTWTPTQKYDLIFSNAAFHWSPNHVSKFGEWISKGLEPGRGVLAFQVPGNKNNPSHRIVREMLTADPKWSPLLKDTQESQQGRDPADYVEALLALNEGGPNGCEVEVDAWETTYIHILGRGQGDSIPRGGSAVLEWMKGTTLRPVLTKLGKEKDGERLKEEFLEDYRNRLDEFYKPTEGGKGTIFPFRRVFVVARRVK